MKKIFIFIIITVCFIIDVFPQNQISTKPIANHILNVISKKNDFYNCNLFYSENNIELNANIKQQVDSFMILNIDYTELNNTLDASPEFLKLQIPWYDGGIIEVLLEKHSITTNDFILSTKSGCKLPDNLNNGLHYWGMVNNNANSSVAISLFNNDVMGLISIGHGNIIIGKLKGSDNYIIYNDLGIKLKNSLVCGNTDNEYMISDNALHYQSPNTVEKCINIYWEINYDIYLEHDGSLENTNNFVMGLFCQQQLLFKNDSINVLLSYLFIWDDPSPYGGETSLEWLTSFQNYSETFNGDIGTLLANVNIGGRAAAIPGLCDSNWDNKKCFASCLSYYNNIPTFSASVFYVTHEQGHLMGSPHTHACVWNGDNTAIDGCYPSEGNCPLGPIPSAGTIMSYCHVVPYVGIDFNLGFGDQPRDLIHTTINNASCIGSCDPTTCYDVFEPNDSCADAALVFASPLNNGPSDYTIHGNLGFAGDQDWFRVNIGDEGTLIINFTDLAYDYDLELYGPNCLNDFISGSYNIGTTQEQIEYTFSGAATTVFAKVYPHNTSNYISASCYSLQFIWNPSNIPYCSETNTLTSIFGFISDGSGESNYSNNSTCSWLISTSGASSISLNFTNFNTEPVNDLINVFDGNSNSSLLLGSFSGDTIPPYLASSSGTMFIEFITNDTITEEGWNASYTTYIPVDTLNFTGFEYWFDDNYLSKVSNTLPPSYIIELNDSIPTAVLSTGLHSFHVRFQDEAGQWSSVISQFFYKQPIPPPGGTKIVAFEYWFDQDYSAKIVEATDSAEIHQLITGLPAESLQQGLHSFHLRYKDNNGNWSSVISQFFYKQPLQSAGGSKIIAYEYWFDQDYLSRIIEETDSVEVYQLITGLPAEYLSQGLHAFHLRYKDSKGVWSSVVSQFFYKAPVTNELPNYIKSYRYWFDMADTNLIDVNLPEPVNPLDLVTQINTCPMEDGPHTIHFQFHDEYGYWSSVLTDTFNIAPVNPEINPDGHASFCIGGSLVLFAGPANAYLWSTGATTPQITVSTPGNYSVTIENTCGDTLTSDIFIVTVDDPTIPGIVTGGTTISLGYPTDTLKLSGNTGSVVHWQKKLNETDYQDIPSTYGTVHYLEIPSTSGTWYYRSVVKNGECNVEFSSPTTVNVFETNISRSWIGVIDEEWNKAGNWSPAGVPSPIDDVIIPGTAPHMPMVKIQGLSCHDLTIHSDASLTIIPGMTLTVNGNVILD